MPGISRDNDTAAGDLIPSQTTVFAEGEEIIVHGNSVVSHSPCPSPASHCAATMVAGSDDVYVGGIAVVNLGDSATCGHTSTGSTTVFVG
jgi:uncharacterized Zn-binding protein involved in type VI secretion